jgi:hypothetical protein
MRKPRRHHTLPAFYLEGFAEQGMLWLFDRITGEYRRQSPRNTAVRRDYYSLKDPKTGEVVDHALEELLARHESDTAPLIARLSARKPIEAEERPTLAHFVALLYTRVPWFERLFLESADRYYKQEALRVMGNEEAAQQLIDEAAKKGRPKRNVSAADLVTFATEAQYTATPPPHFRLQAIEMLAEQLAPVILEPQWSFLYAPSGKAFVAADVPVAGVRGDNETWMVHFGFKSRGALIFVPLSRQVCMVIEPGVHAEHMAGREIREADVREINLAVASHARREVYAHNGRLLRSIVQGTRFTTSAMEPT